MTTRHPDFPQVQRRLANLGFYSAGIDDEWGPGMSAGVDQVLGIVEKAMGKTPPAGPQWPNLPAAYSWIRDIGTLPRHMSIALSLLGTVETAGAANNSLIMGWDDAINAKYPGKVTGYSADSIPWCGLFEAFIMAEAGREPVDQPLWALNWSKWGVDGGQPEFGDTLTFLRDGGGHVANYIAEDKQGYYHIIGGNQSDRVSIMRIAKNRMKACRQPAYINKPASVRTFIVAATGKVSTNEA